MTDLNNQGGQEGDGNEGTPPATSSGGADPNTQPPAAAGNNGDGNEGAGEGQKPKGTTFTQADMDRIQGETRASARRRILKELGYEDFDAAQADIKAFKEHQREQLSEVERLRADLAAAGQTGDELTTAKEQIEALNGIIAAQVEAQMKQLKVPDYVKPLMESMTPQEQLAYLTEHGASFAPEPKAKKKPKTDADGKGTGSSNEAERRKKVRHKFNIS